MGSILLHRLEDWASSNNILADTQYDFKKGLGTIDQGLKLSLLIGKYAVAKKGSIFLAFIDLTVPFDCVSHSKL